MIFKKTNIETYTLDSGVEIIKKEIEAKLVKAKGVFVILVAGGTASGKTSAVAKRLNDFFSDSQILSMDNYYRGPSFMKEHPRYNFDQPEVLNLDLFFKHLKDLKKGNDVMIPDFDFKNDPKMDAIKIRSSKIIIVEGLFALTDQISKLGDFKIFVDLGAHSQILRRLFRDVERTGDKPKDILSYFLDVVSPMHKKYIEPTKKNANVILINDYIPELEAKNAKIKETKLRFKVLQKDVKGVIDEIVYKLGGSYVGKTEQTDYFLNPGTSNFKKTGEILKIRKIGFNRYFFTYFGPSSNKKVYQDRYTMKFFIDFNTLSNLKELFPRDIIEVSRLRRTFFISGVLVCLDEMENGDYYLVFKFDEKNGKQVILDILEHLQIDAKTGTKKSYIELINT
ncbi:MAG: CYTH domain-containing protein [Candidatus Gracilibacteria bacterium]|nr:CYTH domain-containing protein [Candidatus Gracilibacteria bacterium]